MPSFEGIIVLFVIFFIIISLYLEIIGPAYTFLIGVIALGFFGILTPAEILHGFANEQIAVIMLLLLLGDIIRKTSIVEIFFSKVFSSNLTYRGFMARMMIFISGFSAFLNNTPLVAVMMPHVNSWCNKNKINPSKLLIPLSYAAILGGCATLIGTSTNLIVNSFVVEQAIHPDLHELHIFDFLPVGGAMIVIGIAFLLIFSKVLLPNRKTAHESFSDNSRKYIVETQIRKGSSLIGKTIEEAQLRNLEGIYLVEIRRETYRIKAVSPTTILYEGDVLIFAGETESIANLLEQYPGLTMPMVGMLKKHRHTEVHEIVISHNSTLITKTVKEANFRGKYDGAIIGIHRNGERIIGKIGDVKLRAGDVLIILAGPDLLNRYTGGNDFYFISKVKDIETFPAYKTWTLLGGTFTAITLAIFNILPLFMGLISLIMLIVSMKIVSPKDISRSIDYNLAIIIALSLALETAMKNTGVAKILAEAFVTFLKPYGMLSVLFGIYAVTTILASYITSKAAVSLIFPIALTMSLELGANPLPFVLIVAFASAANFMTPIGYQTNLMVYGPGGYTFKDFFKVGFPLTIVYMIVTVFILHYIYF